MQHIRENGGILVPPHDPRLLERYPDGIIVGA
jgi:hypothetical protein